MDRIADQSSSSDDRPHVVFIGALRLLCDVPTLDRDADRFENERYCQHNRADPNRRRKQHQ
jgi:hypothetical protein